MRYTDWLLRVVAEHVRLPSSVAVRVTHRLDQRQVVTCSAQTVLQVSTARLQGPPPALRVRQARHRLADRSHVVFAVLDTRRLEQMSAPWFARHAL